MQQNIASKRGLQVNVKFFAFRYEVQGLGSGFSEVHRASVPGLHTQSPKGYFEYHGTEKQGSSRYNYRNIRIV